ncbi:DUF1538 domain-containing protein [Isachenkonia alkalipeptolytica]|uniref:DUF1538 domain-containing protein n=1 Tax=Isachenkonia alkalipeptolytica TaxID=2565777 RepID=A0AA43XK36_9CLOT|nr:DUF1538 domain-containing protein [Isachenkonia alkalipeptolytica]
MNIFSEKIKEVFFAILPITLIVVILRLTIVPIDNHLMGKFLLGSVFILFGLTLFLIGVDLGIAPLGSLLSSVITKKNKLWLVITAAFVLGFIISIAEPGLLILGNQIDALTAGVISSFTILTVVSLGIGVFMILGFLRLIYNIPLHVILLGSYGIILVLGLFTSPEFLAIAFDSSGSTTGVLAVPFILSLSLGITAMKKDSKASEKDSFGLVAIVSVGAVISVMILNLFTEVEEFAAVEIAEVTFGDSVIGAFINAVPGAFLESLFVFAPLVAIFLLIRFTWPIKKEALRKMTLGFIYALIGLSLFLVGVNTGFMAVGSEIGSFLVGLDTYFYLILIGFILGVATILAEPAVYVLTHQIEDVTSGYVKKNIVLVALALGVGLAISLSLLRIVVPEIQLWHYLLTGYLFAMILTFITPKLFVGIAFDAGGVATGPMTATFILAFINGAAYDHPTADVLVDGFGMIAMVALMPIITLQILGTIFKLKTVKKGVNGNGKS